MQKYWLQSVTQPLSGLPSLVTAGRPVSHTPNCLQALKHLFQLALPSWPGILHLVRVIYILLLIKINSGRQGEKKKTRKQERETKPWRYGSGVGTL